MNLIFVALLATKFALNFAYPADGLVEIEKQRLIKFPEETFRFEENEQKSIEAKRILEEINKINLSLGYVKKQDQSLPSVLDSNKFLFPKPAYHPFHSQSHGAVLEPSIRKLNPVSNQFPYPIKSSKSIKPSSPQLFLYDYLPGNQEFYYDLPSVDQYPSGKNEYARQINHGGYKPVEYKVVGNFEESYENKQEPKLRLYFVPRQLNLNKKSIDYLKNEKLIKIEKVPTIRPFTKATTGTQRSNTKATNSFTEKYITPPATTTTTPSPSIKASLKTKFASFFNRPGHVVSAQNVETKPPLQTVLLASPQYTQQQLRPDPISVDAWDSDSSEESDYPQDYEKHIFSPKRKEMAEVQKEALKESGIIIQRLKVRKGGIAIAGPGGVATAGSGGTAIVGPGGYALTHPRSLTIAGPGAKVIAIPETTDLKDALLRTNSGRSYTDEGEVVATGPVIYYSPDDNSQI